MQGALTLTKEERVCSKKLIEQLFDKGGKRTVVAFPLRVVYLEREKPSADAPSLQMMVSVPKRLLHHAVDRNRVKRRVKEAFRKNKYQLLETMGGQSDKSLALAFVWLDEKTYESKKVETAVSRLLNKVGEVICN